MTNPPRQFLLSLGLAALIALGWSGTTHAQVPIDIGVGAKGGVNFSGITKPDDKTLNNTRYPYPGFFGVGGGGGLFIEPRFLNIIGLEIGFLYEASQGSGDLDFTTNGRTISDTVIISSTDLVIPIHVKAALPMAPTVSFLLGIGADIAIPLDQKVESDVFSNLDVKAREMTTYLGFQLGVEIDLKVIRIPIEFRGRWNGNHADDLSTRMDAESGKLLYIPDWELQGMLYIGAIYPIEIF